MRKYLYLIKKAKIKSWLKFWLMTNKQFTSVLSEILEGFSFNLQNTVKRYFKIFNIFGNSVQNGTPTPENPVPINSVADDVNLFDKNGEDIANGYISASGYFAPEQGNIDKTVYIKCKPNTTYTLQKMVQNTIAKNRFVVGTSTVSPTGQINVNILYRANEGSTITSQTVTTDSNANYLLFFCYNTDSNTSFEEMLNSIKISEFPTVTPYSPYNQGTVTIKQRGTTESNDYTIQTEPLRSLPNGVRDSLEADGIHRKTRYLNLAVADMNNSEDYPGWTNVDEIKSDYPNQTGSFSKLCQYITNIAPLNTSVSINTTGSKKIVFLSKTFFNLTQTQWKEQYPNLILQIQYELPEEIIEPYTEEQQEQYNKIKELYTFDGTTNIYSDDEVPPYLQIQYYMKGE